ncbi:PFGI-1 class ICE element type IV pilus protein PilL2 [Nitrogeniibacter aestuarii]|uniref:PFGI-1 class ICE element type IV pilus protein PilL2 n=1 Tax=Nitrogeniibacter aestuarii TaxID=2815343 RepID=UPI001E3E4331|nr:hypothetical protein [Nitrogeniibacter aestuarii]
MKLALPLLIAMGVPCVANAADLVPGEIRLARYTSAQVADPQPLDPPLLTLVQVQVPRDIITVGGAIDYLLLRTGYHLGDLAPAVADLLRLPLPENHRSLGPARVSDLLSGLVGDPYEVSADDITRTVAISLKPTPAPEVPYRQIPLSEVQPSEDDAPGANGANDG